MRLHILCSLILIYAICKSGLRSHWLKTTPTEKLSENIVEKGENAGNQHFLLFPQCFLPFTKHFFSITFILTFACAFNLDQSKIVSFSNERSTGYNTVR